MRIASVCRSYGNGGGMENVVHDRAEALRALGHEVHIISAPDGLYSDAFAAQCVEGCDRVKPDVICLDSFDGARSWWVERKERVALTLHGTPWSQFFTKWNLWMHAGRREPGASYANMRRMCKIIQQADVVIAISHYEQGLLQDLHGVPDAKCVYNPIAPYFFDTPTVPVPADGYFLCVGNHDVRGFDVAAKAAARAGVPFRVAKGVSREDMVAVYDGCRALVLPTVRPAGYDLTVAEAAARGRPVIVSGVGAYRLDGVPGTCYVPMRDVGAVAEAMGIVGRVHMAPVYASRHKPETHARAWVEAVT